MAKKPTPNDLYWKHMREAPIRDAYQKFLKAENLPDNPDSAHLFALRTPQDERAGMSDRELILFLAGDLPYMYD